MIIKLVLDSHYLILGLFNDTITAECQVGGCLSQEFRKLWEKAAVAYFKVLCLRICFEGLKKTTTKSAMKTGLQAHFQNIKEC